MNDMEQLHSRRYRYESMMIWSYAPQTGDTQMKGCGLRAIGTVKVRVGKQVSVDE